MEKNTTSISKILILSALIVPSYVLAQESWLTEARQAASAMTAAAKKIPAAAKTTAAPSMDVKEFVRQIFMEGVPYDEASRYGGADIPVLLAMLNDPQEVDAWVNIVVVLGASGDQRAIEPLISFLESGAGKLSHDQFVAKNAVLMSLGYSLNKNDSARVLSYLKAGLDPKSWKTRIKWEDPYGYLEDGGLTKQSSMGLALSGRPAAGEALAAFKKGLGATPEYKGVTDEAIKDHQFIAANGLAAYYKKSGQ